MVAITVWSSAAIKTARHRGNNLPNVGICERNIFVENNLGIIQLLGFLYLLAGYVYLCR